MRSAGCLYTVPSWGSVSPWNVIYERLATHRFTSMTYSEKLDESGLSCTVGAYDAHPATSGILRLNRRRPRAVRSRARTHLDRDSAQLTLYRLGFGRPGYVNVQFVIFKIARVLLRTPIKDPGGGNENLTDVAASV